MLRLLAQHARYVYSIYFFLQRQDGTRSQILDYKDFS